MIILGSWLFVSLRMETGGGLLNGLGTLWAYKNLLVLGEQGIGWALSIWSIQVFYDHERNTIIHYSCDSWGPYNT